MNTLPADIQGYFQAAIDGHPALLPPCRFQNRAFLVKVYEALLSEETYTEPDCDHLRVLTRLADSVTLKDFSSVSEFVTLECSLLALKLEVNPKQLRYGLEYLLFLLARHGQLTVNMETIRTELKTWRCVARGFNAAEQPFVSGYVRWLQEQGFSPISTQRHLAELSRFWAWMHRKGFESSETVPLYDLYRYFYERSDLQKSRGALWSSLQPAFHYYKETVDGNFSIPLLYFPSQASPAGANVLVNGEEIDRLWRALVAGTLPDEGALMLLLIVGLGLPLKALPRLRFTNSQGDLIYTEYRPRRQGIWERPVNLPTEEPWVEALLARYLERGTVEVETPYLFQTPSSIKRRRPVSVKHCQRRVQACVAEVLGYPLPVNHLERGALKALARQTGLMDFMARTQTVPLSKQTRMMYWLTSRPRS